MVPLLLFLILDTYYLALEPAFRTSYGTFVEKLHAQELNYSDLYVIAPSGSVAGLFFRSLLSFSIYIFYVPLALTMLLIWWLVIR